MRTVFIVLILVLSGSPAVPESRYGKIPAGVSVIQVIDENGSSSRNVPVDIYRPEKTKTCKKQVLVLPGWDFPRDDWRNKTDIIRQAELSDFCLVFPEMGRAIYAGRYYSETARKVFNMPSLAWITKRLLPELQDKYGIFRKGQKNYIMGLSTGGRGVALISLASPGLFRAGAAFSGDYNQAGMPKDRLMTAVYGSFENFPERWKEDNPYHMADKWEMPLYLGHGKKDRVVPFSQTMEFYEKITRLHPGLDVVLNAPPAAGHDYKYWQSEIAPAFAFFNKN